jgi:hypothetical protein
VTQLSDSTEQGWNVDEDGSEAHLLIRVELATGTGDVDLLVMLRILHLV